MAYFLVFFSWTQLRNVNIDVDGRAISILKCGLLHKFVLLADWLESLWNSWLSLHHPFIDFRIASIKYTWAWFTATLKPILRNLTVSFCMGRESDFDRSRTLLWISFSKLIFLVDVYCRFWGWLIWKKFSSFPIKFVLFKLLKHLFFLLQQINIRT